MQQAISSLQQDFTSMQQECLKYHHPSSSNDEDDTPMAEAA